MLTPSSNTVLEPITQAMLAGIPGVSVHFSRFKVVEISLKPDALAQFDDDALLSAAERLAEARVDVMTWGGTSSGWLGFEADARLCRRITSATGIPATTSMIGLNEILGATGVRRLGLVTPYLDEVQAGIIASYAMLGLTCVGETHLGLSENFGFAAVDERTLRGQVAAVAAAKPEAIAIVCTNLRAAQLVPELEAEHRIPIYDTIATAVWSSLRVAGLATGLVRGWGGIFDH